MLAREGERARQAPRPDDGRRLSEIQAEQTQAADELRASGARVEAALESMLDEVGPDVEERMLARFEARVAGTRAAAAVRPPASDGAPVELNDATVADLRRLMSFTQARRLVRYRDRAGGFRSFEEVDLVPGLPIELRRNLRRALSLGF